jgi:hypothetical protein
LYPEKQQELPVNTFRKLCILLILGNLLWCADARSQGSFSLWDDGSNGLKISSALVVIWSMGLAGNLAWWKLQQKRYPRGENRYECRGTNVLEVLTGVLVVYGIPFYLATQVNSALYYWTYTPIALIATAIPFVSGHLFNKGSKCLQRRLFKHEDSKNAPDVKEHDAYMTVGLVLTISWGLFLGAKIIVASARKPL